MSNKNIQIYQVDNLIVTIYNDNQNGKVYDMLLDEIIDISQNEIGAFLVNSRKYNLKQTDFNNYNHLIKKLTWKKNKVQALNPYGKIKTQNFHEYKHFLYLHLDINSGNYKGRKFDIVYNDQKIVEQITAFTHAEALDIYAQSMAFKGIHDMRKQHPEWGNKYKAV